MLESNKTNPDIVINDSDEEFEEETWDLGPEPLADLPDPAGAHADLSNQGRFESIFAVADLLKTLGLRLDDFLHDLCYGNSEAVSNPITKECQRQLMSSTLLPSILNNLHTPPRYTGARPMAASVILGTWTREHATCLARKEIDIFALEARKKDTGTYSPPKLKDITTKAFTKSVACFAPCLTTFLTRVGEKKAKGRAHIQQDPKGLTLVEPSYVSLIPDYIYIYVLNRLPKGRYDECSLSRIPISSPMPYSSESNVLLLSSQTCSEGTIPVLQQMWTCYEL
jgi:ribosomal protein S24E